MHDATCKCLFAKALYMRIAKASQVTGGFLGLIYSQNKLVGKQ